MNRVTTSSAEIVNIQEIPHLHLRIQLMGGTVQHISLRDFQLEVHLALDYHWVRHEAFLERVTLETTQSAMSV